MGERRHAHYESLLLLQCASWKYFHGGLFNGDVIVMGGMGCL